MPKCFLIGTRRAGTLSTFSSLSASCKTKNVAGRLLANKTKKVNLSKRSAVSSLDSSTYLRNLEAHLHERAIMAALSNDSQASEDGKDCNQSTSSSKVDGQQLECKDHIQLDSLKNVLEMSPGSPRLAAKCSSSYASSVVGDVHICADCGKRYSTSSNLTRHRQIHRSMTDKKARKCPHCEKVYVSVPAYSMHIRTHTQGCQCHFCGKCFSRPWLLQGHIRTHTGEKPFTCHVCNKAFADKSNLRAHVQTHSSAKPYVCKRCDKAFGLKSYLSKHQESSCIRVAQDSPQSSASSSLAASYEELDEFVGNEAAALHTLASLATRVSAINTEFSSSDIFA